MVWIKIRVMPVVAVAGPPAGVDRELRQVSEPMSDQGGVNSRRGAAHQSAKRIEICRSRSLGDQVRVEEVVMSDLIIGVIMDVVCAMSSSSNIQGVGVGWIASSARDFVVLDAAELVVLDPKVGLEYFCSRWEPKQWLRLRCERLRTCLLRLGHWPTVLRRLFLLQRRVICPGTNDG